MAWDPEWLAEIRAGERRRSERRFLGALICICLVSFAAAVLALWLAEVCR